MYKDKARSLEDQAQTYMKSFVQKSIMQQGKNAKKINTTIVKNLQGRALQKALSF